jgi:hypothetical protein
VDQPMRFAAVWTLSRFPIFGALREPNAEPNGLIGEELKVSSRFYRHFA